MIPGPLAPILDEGVAHPGEVILARGCSPTRKRKELSTVVVKTLVPPSSRSPPLIEEPPSRYSSKQIARTSVKRELSEFFRCSSLKVNPEAKSFAGRPEGEHEDGERFPRHGLRG